jgi:hypothetical protein
MKIAAPAIRIADGFVAASTNPGLQSGRRLFSIRGF